MYHFLIKNAIVFNISLRRLFFVKKLNKIAVSRGEVTRIFEEVFFDRTELKKFQLFEIISYHKNTLRTLAEIASVLNLPYQQTYNTYKELLVDLNDLNPNQKLTATKMRDVVQQQTAITVDTYRLYLLKKSIPFQALIYAATTQQPDITAFANRFFISKSTLVRKLGKLRHLLKKYDLALSATTLKLSGREFKLRLFLLTIYRIAFHYSEWPFNTIQQADIAKIIDRQNIPFHSKLARMQAELFIAISRLRVISNHQLSNVAIKTRILADDQLTVQHLFTTRDYPALNAGQLANENLAFYLFYICIAQQQPLTLATFHIDETVPSGNIVLHLLDKFKKFLAKKFPEQADCLNNDRLLQNNLAKLALSYIIIDGHRPEIADFYPVQDIIGDRTYFYRQLQHFVKLEITPLFHEDYNHLLPPSLIHSEREFIDDAYRLIFQHHIMLRDAELVKVKIIIDQDSVLNSVVDHAVQQINYLKVLDNERPWQEADLIISTLSDPKIFLDGLGETKQQIPELLYWSSVNPNHSLNELTNRVEAIFIEKNCCKIEA